MPLLQLRTFVVVYRQRSLTSAAKELGLTQPAVSQHIASLEAQLERPLFTRHSRGITPTIIADELAADVSEKLELAEAALAIAKARTQNVAGTIHLSGPNDILSDLLLDRRRELTSNDI
ncbi:MAG: LysR family transcriptional regulator, partial [Hyphomicrobiaceae bacterium]